MQRLTHSRLKDTLKRKEVQLARVKNRYDQLSYEYRTLRSALDIIDQQEPVKTE